MNSINRQKSGKKKAPGLLTLRIVRELIQKLFDTVYNTENMFAGRKFHITPTKMKIKKRRR
ncbi:MAG: hypothetical protein DBX61_11225 [Clostridiales bacterium]|nr:MAG: hypothetical protein DBX61_11225 [Clostridiales bacterium]